MNLHFRGRRRGFGGRREDVHRQRGGWGGEMGEREAGRREEQIKGGGEEELGWEGGNRREW